MNRVKIMFMLLVGIAFVSNPFIVRADYQISPILNYGTINVGDHAYNNETFYNYNELNLSNDGLINNFGTLNNYLNLNNFGGMLNNVYGGTLNNYTSLRNDTGATLVNNPGATLNNYGSLRNYFMSTLLNSGTLNNNSGTLLNSGTLNNNFGGTLTNNSGAMLTTGYVLNNNSGAILNNNGTMTIDYWQGTSTPTTLDNYGALNNSGTLTNSGGNLNNKSGATLTNSGTLTNNYYLVNYSGATLTNSGTLTNNFVLYNYGALNNSGTLNNYWGMSNSSTGTLNNSGTLNNYYTLYNYGALNNSGTLNNYGMITATGTYTQSAGQTKNNGSMGAASIAINGGTLSGTGTIYGNVTIGSGASVIPGNSPGTLTINGNFFSSGNLIFVIEGLASGQYSVLDIINGSANFTGGTVEYDFINGFSPSPGDSWDCLLATSITGWDTLGFTFVGLGPGLSGNFISIAGGGQELVITQSQAVPEPGILILLGISMASVVGLRRWWKD